MSLAQIVHEMLKPLAETKKLNPLAHVSGQKPDLLLVDGAAVQKAVDLYESLEAARRLSADGEVDKPELRVLEWKVDNHGGESFEMHLRVHAGSYDAIRALLAYLVSVDAISPDYVRF